MKMADENKWKDTWYVQYEADGVLVRDERAHSLAEARAIEEDILDNSAYGAVYIRHNGKTVSKVVYERG